MGLMDIIKGKDYGGANWRYRGNTYGQPGVGAIGGFPTYQAWMNETGGSLADWMGQVEQHYGGYAPLPQPPPQATGQSSAGQNQMSALQRELMDAAKRAEEERQAELARRGEIARLIRDLGNRYQLSPEELKRLEGMYSMQNQKMRKLRSETVQNQFDRAMQQVFAQTSQRGMARSGMAGKQAREMAQDTGEYLSQARQQDEATKEAKIRDYIGQHQNTLTQQLGAYQAELGAGAPLNAADYEGRMKGAVDALRTNMEADMARNQLGMLQSQFAQQMALKNRQYDLMEEEAKGHWYDPFVDIFKATAPFALKLFG